MTTESLEHTVGQLARLSGVTVRTLHHFDRIGLLTPYRTGRARYRVYGPDHLLKLQEILFYRAAGLPLADIAALLSKTSDRLARLQAHLAALEAESARLSLMRSTLERTINHLKGEIPMPVTDLYAPFPPEEQSAHDSWLIGRGVTDVPGLARSRAALQRHPGGQAALLAALKDIEQTFVTAMVQAPDDPRHHGLLEDHRALMAQFWGAPCDGTAYRGLGHIYGAHPGFAAHFEALAPGLTDWLIAAIAAHADRLATT